MDAEQIHRLKPMLTRYLKQFDDCFTQRQTRAHLVIVYRPSKLILVAFGVVV